MGRLPWVLGYLAAIVSGGLFAADVPPPVSPAALAPALREMCSKQIVLLGEDASHGGAQTIAVKAQLVRALVGHCGFRGVVFESQFYDMLDFQKSLDAGTATEPELASAIGALWSRYAVFRPLQSWLFREAVAGRIRVVGMDPQVGGVGARYSPVQLPKALASVLVGDDRTRCEQAMLRHNGWTYDDAHPFDQAAFDELAACAHKIEAMRSSAMAVSYRAYVDSVDPRGGHQGARDEAMYRNLEWMRSQWPKGTKIVVWTASVHASKVPVDGVASLGTYVHDAFADHAYVLGFSALGGGYGSTGGRGPVHLLAGAPERSLEASAFAEKQGSQGDARFLSARRLSKAGITPGRAFRYGTFQTLRWSDYLDGLIVLKEEKVATALPPAETAMH